VLRALGVADRKIYGLVVGKILLYGLAGAALGCWLGRIFSGWLSVATTSPVVAPLNVLASVIIVTPLACVIFGLPPIMSRLMQEPGDILGEGTT
jgi:ABC-type lipoprotein release transport system permease subunit